MEEGPAGTPSGVPRSFASLRPQTENDRVIAALVYIFWVSIPLVVLLTDLKRSPFAFVQALQGLVFGIASVLFVLLCV